MVLKNRFYFLNNPRFIYHVFVLYITSNLVTMESLYKMCVGYNQTLGHFVQGIWTFSDANLKNRVTAHTYKCKHNYKDGTLVG